MVSASTLSVFFLFVRCCLYSLSSYRLVLFFLLTSFLYISSLLFLLIIFDHHSYSRSRTISSPRYPFIVLSSFLLIAISCFLSLLSPLWTRSLALSSLSQRLVSRHSLPISRSRPPLVTSVSYRLIACSSAPPTAASSAPASEQQPHALQPLGGRLRRLRLPGALDGPRPQLPHRGRP